MAEHDHTGTSADSGTAAAIQVTVRAFLMRGENESSDYGLYSYLLFGARPTADNRPLYRKLIEVYMAQLTDAGTQATLTPTRFLNITYLPVADAPTTQGATISDPDWLLDHYDYPRAAAMLSHLNGQPHLAGPYIVSCKRPLSQLTGSDVLGDDYLFQDMTSAPPRIAGPWLQIFEAQACQEQYWIPDRRQQWVVRLRTAIADASDAVPNIQDSLTSWIAWIGTARH